MPAVFSRALSFSVPNHLSHRQNAHPNFFVQNVLLPRLVLDTPIVFSSCCYKGGPHYLTTADWVRNGHLIHAGPSWISLPVIRIHRVQVIDCNSVGLRPAGKSRMWQRKLVYGEQKHKADRPGGETVGLRKREGFEYWHSGFPFLFRPCFYLSPWGQRGPCLFQ